MKMTPYSPFKWLFLSFAVLGAASCSQGSANGNPEDAIALEDAADEYERGPHRGRMLREGDFALELTIFEDGVDPEFRLFPYLNGVALAPSQVTAVIELTRLGGIVDRFEFTPRDDYSA